MRRWEEGVSKHDQGAWKAGGQGWAWWGIGAMAELDWADADGASIQGSD